MARIHGLDRPRRIRAGKLGWTYVAMRLAGKAGCFGRRRSKEMSGETLPETGDPDRQCQEPHRRGRVRRGARASLSAAGVELIDAHAVDDPDEMGPVRQGGDRQGADGHRRRRRRSLSSNSIDFFVGTDTVFALLPLGTANSFARTLGIPLDLDGAIDVIAKGSASASTSAASTATISSNAAAIGLSPMIAETVPHKLKRYLGGSAICSGRLVRRASAPSG